MHAYSKEIHKNYNLYFFKKEISFIFNYFADEIPVSFGNDTDS